MTASPRVEPVFDVMEVAEHLRLSRDMVYRMVANGEIRHFRAGARRKIIRIPESALAEYIAKAG